MNKRSPITTHVLDVSSGRPASGLRCILERQNSQGTWDKLGESSTNEDGRIEDWWSGPIQGGVYRIEFFTQAYFEAKKISTFYPSVLVQFEITELNQHYHVPLLLSPFGYSTYRGS
ncbi:MAG: hydroxyisourate hydrolase [Proteobacteria bacterium]|nr:hydroxyisourate hydrolase [Pseudomonadota bacterium]